MKIDELWEELEREALSSPRDWLSRHALPTPTLPLLVGIEPPARRRVLLLPMTKRGMPPSSAWPECKGLQVFSAELAGQPHLGVRLVDPAFADIFVALAEDVAASVSAAKDPPTGALTLLARLKRWQKFLASGGEGLGPELRRGLYGELVTLRALALSAGFQATINAWRGPEAGHQDFQFRGGAIEVKTTAAKQPQSIRITSERQLDHTGVGSLFLQVIVVDEREVEPTGTVGETLPAAVESVREACRSQPGSRELFEERLFDAGYHESHAARYTTTQYTIRRLQAFRVENEFPRITETSLKPGVGEVSYAISLAACEPYAVPAAEMVTALSLVIT